MDSLAMILLTIPIFFPVILSLGYNPIWFGVVIVLVGEMGVITPPVGSQRVCCQWRGTRRSPAGHLRGMPALCYCTCRMQCPAGDLSGNSIVPTKPSSIKRLSYDQTTYRIHRDRRDGHPYGCPISPGRVTRSPSTTSIPTPAKIWRVPLPTWKW